MESKAKKLSAHSKLDRPAGWALLCFTIALLADIQDVVLPDV